MKPYLVILAGPSGVGKTTLAEALLAENDRYSFVRSVTTRSPRGDCHDSEYLYLTSDEFRAEIAADRILEFTEYNGNLYGTPKSEVERIFGEGKIPLLILDMNGVRSVKSRADGFDVFALYLYSSLDAIEERLYRRTLGDRPTVEGLLAFEKRKKANLKDYLTLPHFAPYFDVFVENSADFDSFVKNAEDAIRTLTAGLPIFEDPIAKAEDLMLEAREKNDRR